MAKQIFINLAVKDLQKSMDFYSALGFTNNQQFSDDSGKCMMWCENIFVMILTHEKFKTFATKPIADTKSNLAGLFSLSVDSIEELNGILTNGLKAGGTEPNEMKDYEPLKILTDTPGKFSIWTLQSFPLKNQTHKLNYF